MQELIGMRLRHKNLGEGVALSCKGDGLTVKFDCGAVATFLIPDIFFGDLAAKDREDEAKIASAIENWKSSASEEQIERFERDFARKKKGREIEEEARRKKEEEQRAKRLEERRRIEQIIANWPVLTWKHITVLVLACVGALCGLLGTIFALVNCGTGTQEADLYFAFYVILGFGGAAVSLIGGLVIFFRKFFGKVVMVGGTLMLVGSLIESIVMFQKLGLLEGIFQPEVMKMMPELAVQMLFLIFACIALVAQAIFALFARTHKKLQ